jgi:hypothetical protein
MASTGVELQVGEVELHLVSAAEIDLLAEVASTPE